MPSEYYRDLHEGYLKTLKLKYSILAKSIPELVGVPFDRIGRLPIDRVLKREATELLSEIKLHEIFFSSFTDRPTTPSFRPTAAFRSAAGLLYSVKCAALSLDSGFVTLTPIKGEIRILAHRDFSAHFREGTPHLALDMCEHSYFGDYGFSRERYLDDFLPRLRLNALD